MWRCCCHWLPRRNRRFCNVISRKEFRQISLCMTWTAVSRLSTMKNTGFATGIPWIAAESDKDGNVAACSTSWYRTPGKSDDWMVTPAITVGSKRAVLRWRAKAGDKDYRDGYSVYISDRGNAPEDFDKSSPVFTTEAEKAVWTERRGEPRAVCRQDCICGVCQRLERQGDALDRRHSGWGTSLPGG